MTFFKHNIDWRAIIKRRVTIDPSTRVGPWVMIDGEAGTIDIGKNCTVNAHCWIGAGRSKVTIGSDTRI